MVLIQEIVNLGKNKIFMFSLPMLKIVWHQTAGYLICDSSSVVIDSEDWKWVLGLGVAGTVPMVIMALLEEGMICGLWKKAK